MSRTGSVKHIHQYFRRQNGLWHCSGIDECTHYVPRNMPEPAGRKSLCWQCGNPFQLTPVNMMEDRPKCDSCLEMLNRLNEVTENLPEVRIRGNALAELKRIAARNAEKAAAQKDEIEVYDPDEHAPECDSFRGMECSCKQ